MLVLAASLLLAAWGTARAGDPIIKGVPIVITGACTEGRTITPTEGKWVTVQSGPSADHVSIDVLFKSVRVWTCGRRGDFLAVVYDHPGERICKPTPSSKPYKGPCAYGWMHVSFLQGAQTSFIPDGNHMLRLCTSKEETEREFCRGFALGIAYFAKEKKTCIPDTSAANLRDVAINFMREHPEDCTVRRGPYSTWPTCGPGGARTRRTREMTNMRDRAPGLLLDDPGRGVRRADDAAGAIHTTKFADYWLWAKNGGYRNRIPFDIVDIFERHGVVDNDGVASVRQRFGGDPRAWI
jgi:hypothetical protein